MYGARAALIAAFLSTAVAAAAQSAPATPPKFEVASVKPCNATDVPSSRGGRKGGRASIDPGMLRLECRSLDDLIRMAYIRFATGKKDSRAFSLGGVLWRTFNQEIGGSPAWIKSDRYTINAKPEDAQTAAMMQGPMLQSLLEDRFKLQIRRDTKEVPVYALAVMSKGGPKLVAARKENCTVLDFTNGPPQPPGPDQPPPCGMFRVNKNGGMDTFGQTLAGICTQFSSALDRDVVDRTGITGTFDIHLDLTFDDLFARQDSTPGTGDPAMTAATADPLGAIMRALQKLGLKLEKAKATGEFLVIEHVERPSAN
jgi:uncharacterized protein (TIGR03435 family)